MQQHGFKSSFKITIIRNIPLEKAIITAPNKIKKRRGTVDVVMGDAKRMHSGNFTPIAFVSNGSHAASSSNIQTNQIESSSASIENNDIAINVGGLDSNIDHPSDERDQRGKDAVAIWKKWSFLSNTNIPFGVRGRRRNSMSAQQRLTLSPIIECDNEGTDN